MDDLSGPQDGFDVLLEVVQVSLMPLKTVCCASIVAIACATSKAPERGKAWETMDRATLDAAYNNSKAVPESGAMFKGWPCAAMRGTAARGGLLPYLRGAEPRPS